MVPLHKEAFKLLKENNDINFVGNMEARDFLSGNYDIVVADGFSGNVLLKSTEGACKILMQEIKQAIMGGFMSKIGGLFIKGSIKELKQKHPDVEKCIFGSLSNVNIDTVLAYKTGGRKHYFLDNYDKQ